MMKHVMFAGALGALALSGCATYKMRYEGAASPGGKVHEQKQAFFLWGLAGGTDVNLEQLCPAGVARIESERSVGDQLLTVITGGLYAPMSVEVECASGTGYRLQREHGRPVQVTRLGTGDAR
jgi:hypothetical protein